MKTMDLSKNIASLRKKKGITQEQLALALNLSPQAVSKWETNVSQPDVQTLPLIADYFNVSIDYLFYGQDLSYQEIYDKVFRKVAEHPQMSRESFEDALALFGAAHHGLIRGSLRDPECKLYAEPLHISNENGVSLASGKGYGAIVTRSFFEAVNDSTAHFAIPLLAALSESDSLCVCMAILSMHEISFAELQEKTRLDAESLRKSLDRLIDAGLVTETESRHRALGLTYEIPLIYHACLCILFATLEMQRRSLEGVSACMGYGDFPIRICETSEKSQE